MKEFFSLGTTTLYLIAINFYFNCLGDVVLKIFHIVGNLKNKCGHLDLLYAKVGAKVGVKVATFHTGLFPELFLGRAFIGF